MKMIEVRGVIQVVMPYVLVALEKNLNIVMDESNKF